MRGKCAIFGHKRLRCDADMPNVKSRDARFGNQLRLSMRVQMKHVEFTGEELKVI